MRDLFGEPAPKIRHRLRLRYPCVFRSSGTSFNWYWRATRCGYSVLCVTVFGWTFATEILHKGV